MTASRAPRPLPVVVGALLALGGLAATSARAAPTPLERCRTADKEFDYEVAVTECGLAAAAPGAVREDLVDVYRILGIAHTALGDAAAAKVWFLRLLVLDPGHEMGDDVSPVYRESFAAARAAFLEEGKIAVQHDPPPVPDEVAGPLRVSFVIVDKLDRVRAARVEVSALGEGIAAPVQVALQQDAGVSAPAKGYSGQIVALGPPGEEEFTLTYRLILIGADGAEIAPEPAFEMVKLPVTVAHPAVAGGGGGSFPWLWVGVGGAAGVGTVAVLGVSAAAAVACVVTGICVPSPRVPQSQVRVGPALDE